MKSQNLWIAGLTTSAAVLAAALMFMSGNNQPAQAEMNATGGDFTMIAHSIAPAGNAELVTVVDNRGSKLITYQLRNDGFHTVGVNDLAKSFAPPVTPKGK